MSRKLLPLLALVLISGLAFYSCYSPGSIEPKALVIAIESNPTNLDPRLAADAASVRIIQLIYNGLMKWDENFKLMPDLAERVENPDPITYIFTLKPGVKFHHGKELTAQDVKYTLESILDPGLKSPNFSSLEPLKEVEVLDNRRLRLKLKQPFAPFLSSLTIGIVPEDLARKAGYNLGTRPVGTGPFLLETRAASDRFVLAANRDYFEGRPSLGKVVIKVVPDDTVRVMELMSGAVNLIVNAIPPDMLPVLQKEKDIQIKLSPGTAYSYLGFNLKDPILSKREVRAAIAHAIDRPGIIKHLLKGTAYPATGILAPANFAYEPRVEEYRYDPERARALLDKAGYPLPAKGGPRFRLSYKTSQNDVRRLIGEALMAQLKEVGIDVTMRSYEWGTFFNDIRSGNFQIYTLTWVGISDPDVLYYIFHSESAPPKGANRGRYSNLAVDRLLVAARGQASLEKRKELYGQVQKLLAHDLPYVSLWYTVNVAAWRKEVKGFRLTPAADFTSLKEVRVE